MTWWTIPGQVGKQPKGMGEGRNLVSKLVWFVSLVNTLLSALAGPLLALLMPFLTLGSCIINRLVSKIKTRFGAVATL